MTDTIRARVQELLDARPELTQAEFGKAIGRGYSWVSAFLGGKRDANDITLLVRIARFFGVSVGYLLGEKEKTGPRDATLTTLLSLWPNLNARARHVVLRAAQAHFEKPDD